MSLRIAACALFLALGVQGAQRASGLGHRASGFVRALEFKHRLRVCNMYPYAAPLELYRGHEKITKSGMPYKSCDEFQTPLKAGDKLEFRVGDANAGTFSVSDLPQNDATLLLTIHRHDTLSTAVSFESHVFANLLNAQVAIIDTYKGAAKANMKIQDSAAAKGSRSEELRFDSVVAVNPGEYQVLLVSSDGETKAKTALVALNRESYVVIRAGVEAQQGQAYPQELVVYPKSDPATLRGAAATQGFSLAFLAVLMALYY